MERGLPGPRTGPLLHVRIRARQAIPVPAYARTSDPGMLRTPGPPRAFVFHRLTDGRLAWQRRVREGLVRALPHRPGCRSLGRCSLVPGLPRFSTTRTLSPRAPSEAPREAPDGRVKSGRFGVFAHQGAEKL